MCHPDHPVFICGGIVRQRRGPRQIVFGDDDARRFPLGARDRLQWIRPMGSGAEIDRSEILGGRLRARLLHRSFTFPARAHVGPDGIHGSTATGIRAQLRTRHRAALRVPSHALDDRHELARGVTGANDRLERVALRAVEQPVLHLVGAGPAREPLAVRELRGKVLRLAQVQIELTCLLRRDGHGSRTLQLVPDCSNANRVRARLHSAPGKAVAALGVAHHGDGDRRTGAFRADEHALHGAFVLRAHNARQGGGRGLSCRQIGRSRTEGRHRERQGNGEEVRAKHVSPPCFRRLSWTRAAFYARWLGARRSCGARRCHASCPQTWMTRRRSA
jgi:hypothetical protein